MNHSPLSGGLIHFLHAEKNVKARFEPRTNDCRLLVVELSRWQCCAGPTGAVFCVLQEGGCWVTSRHLAPEADILQTIGGAISEDNDDKTPKKRHPSNHPAGLTGLLGFIKCIAQCCTRPPYVRFSYGNPHIVNEFLVRHKEWRLHIPCQMERHELSETGTILPIVRKVATKQGVTDH